MYLTVVFFMFPRADGKALHQQHIVMALMGDGGCGTGEETGRDDISCVKYECCSIGSGRLGGKEEFIVTK